MLCNIKGEEKSRSVIKWDDFISCLERKKVKGKKLIFYFLLFGCTKIERNI